MIELKKDQMFGRLKVVREIGHHLYECSCECGNSCNVLKYNLIAGRQVSCGCWIKEVTSKRRKREAELIRQLNGATQ